MNRVNVPDIGQHHCIPIFRTQINPESRGRLGSRDEVCIPSRDPFNSSGPSGGHDNEILPQASPAEKPSLVYLGRYVCLCKANRPCSVSSIYQKIQPPGSQKRASTGIVAGSSGKSRSLQYLFINAADDVMSMYSIAIFNTERDRQAKGHLKAVALKRWF
ncbi:hypothetical protein BS17DRAFT_445145 [Gyrodon lividus]|nr:hypothetical protein BS17DRAFT_445145 [Gyrodon lividus]